MPPTFITIPQYNLRRVRYIDRILRDDFWSTLRKFRAMARGPVDSSTRSLVGAQGRPAEPCHDCATRSITRLL
jgi:hypothetical protein